MANDMDFQVCPETGIGCLMMKKDGETIKVDLMPDEASDLRAMALQGNLKGVKTILADISHEAETAMDEESLEALAKEMR